MANITELEAAEHAAAKALSAIETERYEFLRDRKADAPLFAQVGT